MPVAIRQAVSFPVYFPTPLPAGLRLVDGSFAASHGIVSYTLTTVNGKQLAVTIQANPSDGSQDQLSGSQEFRTLEGKAYVVDFDDRTTGSLVTDKAWVIVNSPEPIGADLMHQVLSDLAPAK